jgi:hypothetical protein
MQQNKMSLDNSQVKNFSQAVGAFRNNVYTGNSITTRFLRIRVKILHVNEHKNVKLELHTNSFSVPYISKFKDILTQVKE